MTSLFNLLRSSPAWSSLLILAISVVIAISLVYQVEHINQILPIKSIHKERDFSALLLNVTELEKSLSIFQNIPDQENRLQLKRVIGIVRLHIFDNSDLYLVSSRDELKEIYQDINDELNQLSIRLADDSGVLSLGESVEAWQEIHYRLRGINTSTFQTSVEGLALQKQRLERLNLWLLAGVVVIALGSMLLIRLILNNRRIISQLTEHKQALTEKDDMLVESVESVSEGFVIYDQNDCFVTCNEAYRQLYHTSSDLFVPGESFSEIIRIGVVLGQYPAAAGNEEDWIKERIRLHQNPSGDIVQQRLDDGTWLQITEHKTRSGYIVGNRVDITPLKRVESELRAVKEGLEEQVLERTGALLEAKENAERANRSKSEFLTNMSHELRTPLHGLMSFSEMGKKRAQYLDKEKIERYFENIHLSGKRLLVLINDLLDYSKLDSGKFRLEMKESNFDTIWQQATHELESLAGKRGIKFEYQAYPEDTVCFCDHQRIQQVVSNILSNAIKFSPDNSTVGCEVKAVKSKAKDEKEIDALQVTISDEGEGVNEENLGNIFEKFTQMTNSNNAIQGTGLGLAICKELIGLHQGRIWAENNSGSGMRFIFVIPRKSV